MSILQKYRDFFFKSILNHSDFDESKLIFWKDRLFAYILIAVFPVSFLAYIPSMWIALSLEIYVIAIIDTLAVAGLTAAMIMKSLSMRNRKRLFFTIAYILAASLQLYLGNNGPGTLYLLSISVTATLISERKFVYLTIPINFLLGVLPALAPYLGTNVEYINDINYQIVSSFVYSANLLMLNVLVVVGINTLLDGLSKKIEKEISLNNDLRAERERQEETLIELETSRADLQSFFNHANAGIAIANENGDILECNSILIDIVGYSTDEIVNMNFAALTHPDDLAIELEKAKLMITGEVDNYRLEKRYIRKDGEIVWVDVSIFPLLDDKGQIRNYMAIVIDIHEKKIYELELKRRNDFIQTVMDNLPIGIALNYINDGSALYMNKKMEEIYGWPKEEISDVATFFDLVYPDPDYKSYIVNMIMRDIQSGDANRMQWEGLEITKKDGSKAFVKAVNIPLFDQNTMVSTVIDITERVIREREMMEAKNKAEESDRLKSAFLANMSHEIRTPMNGIIGFINLLKAEILDEEERQEYLELVKVSSDRLLNIINDIIDISKIEAGQIEVNLSDTYIYNEMKETVELHQNSAAEKGLKLYANIGNNNKDLMLQTDSIKLEQILSNLISNAIKFTHKGEIEVGYIEHENYIEIYVKDSGIGIPEHLVETIFDRFSQVETSLSRGHEGAGIGLSIVKAYISLMGGKITVKSQVGIGSTFSFTIPIVKSLSEKNNVDNIEEKIMETPNEENQKLRTILIVEDDEHSYLLIRTYLRNSNYALKYARNGIEAIEYVKQGGIDLVLMDIKMPFLDGYEATKAIKQINPSLPIIAQTAFAMEEDIQHSKEIGCDYHLSKPINKTLLLDTITRFIRN